VLELKTMLSIWGADSSAFQENKASSKKQQEFIYEAI